MGVKPTTIRTFCPALFQLTQHPRRAGHDAAQGHDRSSCSTRSTPTVKVAGSLQRRPARGPTARCSATCSTARASSRGVRAQGLSRCRGAVRSWSAAAASARRSRHRLPPQASARMALFDADAAAAEASGRAPAAGTTRTSRSRTGSQRSGGLRRRRQRDAARHERPAIRCRSTSTGIAPTTFVGEVVMKSEITPLLRGGAGPRLPVPGRHRHAVRA